MRVMKSKNNYEEFLKGYKLLIANRHKMSFKPLSDETIAETFKYIDEFDDNQREFLVSKSFCIDSEMIKMYMDTRSAIRHELPLIITLIEMISTKFDKVKSLSDDELFLLILNTFNLRGEMLRDIVDIFASSDLLGTIIDKYPNDLDKESMVLCLLYGEYDKVRNDKIDNSKLTKLYVDRVKNLSDEELDNYIDEFNEELSRIIRF